jgi:hypothetical protein
MAFASRRYENDEFAERGDKIYATAVLPRLKSSDNGKFAAIDLETGDYEMQHDELAACQKLRARLPQAQIWVVRIGSRYVHRFGGRNRALNQP